LSKINSKKPVDNTDYLEWESDLSIEQVFAAGESFAYPEFFRDGVIYLTQLKKENSRSALMFKSRSEDRCLTPSEFSLRTKISEYGGKPYWLIGDVLYFANQADQCLYRQNLANDVVSAPVRITPQPSQCALLMYSDVVELDDTTLLVIVEQARDDSENRSFIAKIDLNCANEMPEELISGADFYSNLVLDKQRKRLAWVQWNHPLMPWDDTELYWADLKSEAQLTPQHVELSSPACVCQLIFADNGNLFFSADFSEGSDPASGYWNIFTYSFADSEVTRVSDYALEFGYPHWQYGDARIVQYQEQALLAIASTPQGDRLFEIDSENLSISEANLFKMDRPNCTIQNLATDGAGRLTMVRLDQTQNPCLVVYDQGVHSMLSAPHNLDQVSTSEHIEFETSEGRSAYGFYYPPSNAKYCSEKAPPLIVLVHGGPTSRAYGHFDIQKQFWTSRGFALLDVNHRGSSGYGRAYRDALYGQWGELDTRDIIDGINALVKQDRADPLRVCIRGKSAGGYAVLRALTEYPDVFRAGACYYGIGNLATLAEATHKFEKFYTDRLIGEAYAPTTAASKNSKFYQRSPIHKMSSLKSAMIVFQGLQDKVVPPEVAREVVDVLKNAGVEHSYVEYADEGHGFRQVKNNIDAWTKELAFYRRVLRVV